MRPCGAVCDIGPCTASRDKLVGVRHPIQAPVEALALFSKLASLRETPVDFNVWTVLQLLEQHRKGHVEVFVD
jgi:hypothetical protein